MKSWNNSDRSIIVSAVRKFSVPGYDELMRRRVVCVGALLYRLFFNLTSKQRYGSVSYGPEDNVMEV